MKSYILVHTHNNGTDVHGFSSARSDVPLGWHGPGSESSAVEDLCRFLGVDFEPDREETLEVHEAPEATEEWK